eukprot:3709793-Pyramimonas_sp.AAC.1
MRMQGPWRATSKLLERGAAPRMGRGGKDAMQGYSWKGCPCLSCGLAAAGRGNAAQGRFFT